MFKVGNWINFAICTHPWIHHNNQESEHTHHFPKFPFFKVHLFWERERDYERGEAEGGGERICAVHSEPDLGLNLTNCEIMSWAEIRSQMLNWLSHPGVPFFILFYFLSRLHTQCGAWTHNPEVKSCMLYQLSHPGSPKVSFWTFAITPHASLTPHTLDNHWSATYHY